MRRGFTVGVVFAVICAACGKVAASGADTSASDAGLQRESGAATGSEDAATQPFPIDLTATQGLFEAIAWRTSQLCAFQSAVASAPSPSILCADENGVETTLASNLQLTYVHAFAWGSTGNDQPPALFWIDGSNDVPHAPLHTLSNGADQILFQGVTGTTLYIGDNQQILADLTLGDSRCIASINDADAGFQCTLAHYGLVPAGGNGFRVVNGTIYSVDEKFLYRASLAGNDAFSSPLPSVLTSCTNTGGCVYDVTSTPSGMAYVAGVGGVYSFANDTFTNVFSQGTVTQVEVMGAYLYALVSANSGSLFRISLADVSEAPVMISNDIQQLARFVLGDTAIYWITNDGKAVVHAPLQ